MVTASVALAVTTNEPVLIGVTFRANDAVRAYELLKAAKANEAVVALAACEALVAFRA